MAQTLKEWVAGYSYDADGNITSITNANCTTTYVYDELNQLIRENNETAGYSYVYTYTGGNITSRTTYDYTVGELGDILNTETWTYGNTNWPDLLTSYCDGSSTYTVSSDGMGNVTRISDGTNYVTNTWLGRLLTKSIVVEDGVGTQVQYEYNSDGQRTVKYTTSSYILYHYNGDILAGMMIGSNPWVFMYDENGDYFGFTYGGNSYYYVKNLQGDVVGITNASGALIVRYSYDAWGKLLAVTGNTTIGNLNPIRYRSYYYDTETGYYYLNSRYYDPELCRFISADTIELLGASGDFVSYNLYAYCGNSPISRVDESGALWNIIAGGVIGGVVSFVTSVATNVITGEKVDFSAALVSAAIGAATGAAIAMCPALAPAINAVSGAGEALVTGLMNKENAGEIVINMAVSASLGAVTGSWGDSFSGASIIDDAVGSIGRRGKGNHPSIKRAAQRTIRQAIRYLGSSTVENQTESLAVSLVGWGVSKSIKHRVCAYSEVV